MSSLPVIHQFSFYAHILIGTAALILFWIPIVSRKGGVDHRKFGKIYSMVMYAVAATGALMAIIVLYDPMLIHGHRLSDVSRADVFTSRMRVFYSLLLFLSLLVYVGIRHGQLALKAKTNHSVMRSPTHLFLNFLLCLSSIALLGSGINNSHTLSIIFGVLGLAGSIGNLRFCLKNNVGKQRWLVEHLSSYIGTGIGAYTAFLTFGGRSLFSDIGSWQLVFWVLPGVIGGIAIHFYSKKYMPKSLA